MHLCVCEPACICVCVCVCVCVCIHVCMLYFGEFGLGFELLLELIALSREGRDVGLLFRHLLL